jgi:hypothetical protein
MKDISVDRVSAARIRFIKKHQKALMTNASSPSSLLLHPSAPHLLHYSAGATGESQFAPDEGGRGDGSLHGEHLGGLGVEVGRHVALVVPEERVGSISGGLPL